MIKLTVSFEKDGNRYRTLSVEGSDSDIAAGLIALAAEWKAKAIVGVEEDAETRLKREIAAILGPKYGADIVDRLNTRMGKASAEASRTFFKLVVEGRADWAELPKYVCTLIRAEFLSEVPDFPEKLLDDAIAYAETRLRAETGL